MPEEPKGDADLLASSPFDDDLDAELVARPSQRLLPGPTLYLAAGVILVAGFLGGVQAHKWSSDGSSGGAAGGQESGRSRTGGYGGPPGASAPQGGYGAPGNGANGGPGAGPGGMPGDGSGSAANGRTGNVPGTAGTVTRVVGSTLYLRTASGETVKVRTTGKTKIRIVEDGELRDLGAGTTVVVQGSTGQDGSLTATTVNEGSGR
ncbi:hypothetical protein ACQEU6_32525 [Spirillospora sp. CA-108201]